MDQKGSPQAGLRVQCIPDCPVCWSSFNDAENAPLVLHCGHTLCESCIEQLVMIGNDPGRYALQCPECRDWCLWAGTLPRNFLVLRALSYAAPQAVKQHRPRDVLESAAVIPCRHSRPQVSVKSWISRVVEDKAWGVVALMKTITVFLCFLPISFVHMLFWWWTAAVGGIVFCWFTVGGLGMGLFFTFVTGTCYFCRLLRLFIQRHLFGDPLEPCIVFSAVGYNWD